MLILVAPNYNGYVLSQQYVPIYNLRGTSCQTQTCLDSVFIADEIWFRIWGSGGGILEWPWYGSILGNNMHIKLEETRWLIQRIYN